MVTWRERVLVLRAEVDLEPADAVVERALRLVADRVLDCQGDQNRKEDGQDDDGVDDLADAEGPQPLGARDEDEPEDGDGERLEEAVQPDEVVEEEHDDAASGHADNVHHREVEHLHREVDLESG